MFECSKQAPWGIHLPVRNDEDCPRCGWTAPGRGPELNDRSTEDQPSA